MPFTHTLSIRSRVGELTNREFTQLADTTTGTLVSDNAYTILSRRSEEDTLFTQNGTTKHDSVTFWICPNP